MATKRKSNDLWNMKNVTLLSLVGITSIALTHAGWAAGYGGGGGGFHGGGFGGGHAFGGARFSPPAGHFSTIPPGHSFASFGTRPSYRQPVYNGRAGRSVTPSVGATTAANRQQNPVVSLASRTSLVSPSAVAKPSDQRALSARTHIFARQNGNSHPDWDQRHAHYANGHWWLYDSGAWVGLDGGYYPWDYYPYYAYDYYPYDYYAGDNAGAYSYVDQNADPTVSAVQSSLANLGYYQGVVDGLFGPDTRSALTRYQIDNHLSVTGSLTADTLQSLGLPGLASS
ncbi:MAG TPA: peptidoglycan-binding domain-containing protein [Chthoniobacterales bacterium]